MYIGLINSTIFFLTLKSDGQNTYRRGENLNSTKVYFKYIC